MELERRKNICLRRATSIARYHLQRKQYNCCRPWPLFSHLIWSFGHCDHWKVGRGSGETRKVCSPNKRNMSLHLSLHFEYFNAAECTYSRSESVNGVQELQFVTQKSCDQFHFQCSHRMSYSHHCCNQHRCNRSCRRSANQTININLHLQSATYPPCPSLIVVTVDSPSSTKTSHQHSSTDDSKPAAPLGVGDDLIDQSAASLQDVLVSTGTSLLHLLTACQKVYCDTKNLELHLILILQLKIRLEVQPHTSTMDLYGCSICRMSETVL